MPVKVINFDKGFAPDLDPRTEGIFTDTSQLYPTTSSFRPFLQPLRESTTGVPTPSQGAYFTEYTDLTDIIIVGTATKLYSYNFTTKNFTDISNNQTFNLLSTSRWRYTTFGNDIIALNGVDPPQKITKTGGVANSIPTAPIGSITESVGNFVFIFNTTSLGNDWNCCAIGNDALWTPDIGTQAANGVLGDTPGPITAARQLGQNNILVYKKHATYLGTYIGPPIIWGFTLLSDNAGALAQECVIKRDGYHIMIGSGQFYTCDGNPPQLFDVPLRKFFFENSFSPSQMNPIGTWDKFHNLNLWFYQTGTSLSPGSITSRYICHHAPSNRWTTGVYANLIQDVILPYVRVTSLGVMTPPFQLGAVVPYYGMALLLGDNNIWSFSGKSAPATLTTGDVGDPQWYSFLRLITPLFKNYPGGGVPLGGTQQPGAVGAVCTPLKRYVLGGTQLSSPQANLNQYGQFAVRQSARWHAAEIELMVDAEIMGMEVDFDPQGKR